LVISKTLMLITIVWVLLSAGLQGQAGEQEPCAPFLHGKVDQSRVESMWTAAKGGHLYRIQPDTSRVGICVDSQFAVVKAEFRDFQGGLTLWPDNRGHKGQAMILVRTASLDTDGSMIEYMLKSKRFFDVVNYPEILFVSTGIKWTSDTTGTMKGDLTLHNVTRPVTFNVTLLSVRNKKGKNAWMILVKAGTTIRRSDFGMDTLSQVVNDKVELCMMVTAFRYRG